MPDLIIAILLLLIGAEALWVAFRAFRHGKVRLRWGIDVTTRENPFWFWSSIIVTTVGAVVVLALSWSFANKGPL